MESVSFIRLKLLSAIIFVALALANVQAFSAEKSCSDMAGADIDIEGALTELARFQIEVEDISDLSHKAMAVAALREKAKEIKALVGDTFKERLMAKVEEIRSGTAPAKEAKVAEEVKAEETAKAQTETILQWTRLETHPDLRKPGPFIDEDQMFVIKEESLAIYNLREKKYTWENSLTTRNGGQKLRYDTKLLLTPEKDFLIIVAKEDSSVGIINIQTKSYNFGKLKTSRNSGFRFAKLSKNGQHLFLGGEDGESIIFKVPSMEKILHVVAGDYPHGKGIVESPDGRYVFFIRSDNHQYLYDLKEEKEIPIVGLKAEGFYHCYDAIFSPDSSRLTLLSHNNDFLDFVIPDKKIVKSKYKGRGTSIDLSQDGSLVIIKIPTRNVSGKPKPFRILKADDGTDVTPDLSKIKFHDESDLEFFPEHDLFFFTDQVSVLGQQHPKSRCFYVVDLKTLTLKKIETDRTLHIMGFRAMSASGKSLFGVGNGGPVYEFR